MNPVPPTDGPDPAAPVTEADRQVMVDHIQRAVVADVLDFDQLDDRFSLIFRANTRAELDAVAADLPAPPAPQVTPVGHLAPSRSIRLIGDTKIGGWVDLEGDLTCWSIVGDVFVDLSSAELPDDVTITVWTLIGDVTVILPDGVRTALSNTVIIGDRTASIAPARLGASTVRVKFRALIGDSAMYSLSQLPKGRVRKLWRRLRGL